MKAVAVRLQTKNKTMKTLPGLETGHPSPRHFGPRGCARVKKVMRITPTPEVRFNAPHRRFAAKHGRIQMYSGRETGAPSPCAGRRRGMGMRSVAVVVPVYANSERHRCNLPGEGRVGIGVSRPGILAVLCRCRQNAWVAQPWGRGGTHAELSPDSRSGDLFGQG